MITTAARKETVVAAAGAEAPPPSARKPPPHAVDEELDRGDHQERQAEEDRQVTSEEREGDPDELAQVALLVEVQAHAPMR
jgi:hypothetical protein